MTYISTKTRQGTVHSASLDYARKSQTEPCAEVRCTARGHPKQYSSVNSTLSGNLPLARCKQQRLCNECENSTVHASFGSEGTKRRILTFGGEVIVAHVKRCESYLFFSPQVVFVPHLCTFHPRTDYRPDLLTIAWKIKLKLQKILVCLWWEGRRSLIPFHLHALLVPRLERCPE